MKNENPTHRFGESGDDLQNLVQAWQESKPSVSQADWSPLWAAAVNRASTGYVEPSVAKPIFGRLAIAASLLLVTGLGWRLLSTGNTLDESSPNISQVPQSEGLVEASPVLVKIDLQEADDLAIIRLDDQVCTPEAPCLESVEAATADSGGTALASNFQLFNDLESIATDLR